MSRVRFKSGFSIMELIVVIAIALVLGGILLGIGNQIREQGNTRLAQSTIDIIVCALEQYYVTCNDFPFTAIAGDPYIEANFELTLGIYLNQTPPMAKVNVITGVPADEDWSSGALHYFLQKIPNSKNIINALHEDAHTTKASNGVVVQLELDFDNDSTVDEVIFFDRFIDPWGNSFMYTYSTGQSFPEIVSAGPDGVFGSGDDISNKH